MATQASATPGGTPVRRRWYALTDNGDWMELTPHLDHDPFSGPGVSFLAVDVEDDDEFYLLAGDGEGQLLGRVTIVDGRPAMYTSDRAASTEAARNASSPA